VLDREAVIELADELGVFILAWSRLGREPTSPDLSCWWLPRLSGDDSGRRPWRAH
jgi:hypothetical protein